MNSRIYTHIRMYARSIAIVSCGAIVVLGGALAWRLIKNNQQEAALLEYYALLPQLESVRPQALDAVAAQAAHVGGAYAGTSASVLLHALSGRAYSLVNDWDAARAQFALAAQAAAGYDKPTSLLYQTSAAVTGLNSTDSAVVQSSLSDLQRLADDVSNMHRAMAQFYLGYYAYQSQNVDAAQTHWQSLFDAAGQPTDPWGWRVRQIREAVV